MNLTAQVADLLRDSSGPELDRGLLYGSLPTEPKGVVPNCAAVDGTDLSTAITAAIGAIGDAGGTATHIAGKPSLFAHERNIKATGSGEFLYPLGVGPQFGLTEVGVPGWPTAWSTTSRGCSWSPDHRLRDRHEPGLLLRFRLDGDPGAGQVRGRDAGPAEGGQEDHGRRVAPLSEAKASGGKR